MMINNITEYFSKWKNREATIFHVILQVNITISFASITEKVLEKEFNIYKDLEKKRLW